GVISRSTFVTVILGASAALATPIPRPRISKIAIRYVLMACSSFFSPRSGRRRGPTLETRDDARLIAGGASTAWWEKARGRPADLPARERTDRPRRQARRTNGFQGRGRRR